MLYVVIGIIVLVIIAILLWVFLGKKDSRTFYLKNNRMMNHTPIQTITTTIQKNSYSTMRNDHMMKENDFPISTYHHPMNVNEPSVVQTEHILLDMNRKVPSTPTHDVFSDLKSDGNPWIGDLPIKPRTTGINVPLSADVRDLNSGYFNLNGY